MLGLVKFSPDFLRILVHLGSSNVWMAAERLPTRRAVSCPKSFWRKKVFETLENFLLEVKVMKFEN